MKNNGWTNMLFAMVFIAVPFLVTIFYIFSLEPFNKDLLPTAEYSYAYIVYLTLGITVYALGLSFLVVWLKVLHVDSLKFNVPIILVFMVLMFTYNDGEFYYMIPFSILALLTAIPANIFVTKFKESRINR